MTAGILLAFAILALAITFSYNEKATNAAPLPPPAPLSTQANEKESEYSNTYSRGNTKNENNQPAPLAPSDQSVTQLEDDETSNEAVPESKTEEAASAESFYVHTGETDIDNLILQLDDRLIDYSELIGYDQSQTAFIRNGVYALSGLIFTKRVYIDYFSPKVWYVPYSEEPSVVVERFNNYQSKNLKTILEYESNMGWR